MASARPSACVQDDDFPLSTTRLDNVPDLAHHFFRRCLAAEVTPYVVTKKTVFKWQEPFWAAMKATFDAHYKQKYLAAGTPLAATARVHSACIVSA